jgi:transcriptional regulator with XRE-family HTH domain
MTPFGARVRRLRRERGITLKKMAGDLNLSPAYLSALEHGRRGRPAPGLVRQVCAYFDIIWDEAEELERLARLRPRSSPTGWPQTSATCPPTR